MTIDIISLTGFLLSIIFLSYSAYSDLKTREVSDRVWVIYLSLSAVVLMSKLFLDPRLLTISVISIAATICLSLIMFYIGVFGGADAKAFICLSVALLANSLGSFPA